MTFGDKLTALRKENGYPVRKAFAEKIGMPETTLRNYEKGEREPGHSFLVEISEMFDVSIDWLLGASEEKERKNTYQLKTSEYEFVEKYRSLDATGRAHVDTIMQWESERISDHQSTIIDFQSRQEAELHTYPYLQKIASAGMGFYFDDIPTDTINVPYCPSADFVIGVSGDSMEPTYYNGDLVYVKKQQEIDIGNVGIFSVGNECYIKERGENGLISHNKAYKIMPGTENIICIGKVLGKVEK